jgi:HSP20 family protein
MSLITRKNPNQTLASRSTDDWRPMQMFENMLRWDPMSSLFSGDAGSAAFVPHVDVTETPNSYVFTADLPGVREDQLDISLTGNQLVISGKRESGEAQEGSRYHLYERTYGQFTRTFSLPSGIDPEQVTANLKDGVLTLTVGKRPEVQPRRIQLSQKAQGKA